MEPESAQKKIRLSGKSFSSSSTSTVVLGAGRFPYDKSKICSVSPGTFPTAELWKAKSYPVCELRKRFFKQYENVVKKKTADFLILLQSYNKNKNKAVVFQRPALK